MNVRLRYFLGGLLLAVAPLLGCNGDSKSSGTAGSPGPSLDSPSAAERASAAREAAKKYGAEK